MVRSMAVRLAAARGRRFLIPDRSGDLFRHARRQPRRGPCRLAAAIAPRYRPLILLGADGGLRIAEMAGPRSARVALAAVLCSVGRVWAGVAPLLTARRLTLSTLMRDRSIRPASPSSSSRTRVCRSNTPARVQAANRRSAVAALPQPSSRAGSSSQGVTGAGHEHHGGEAGPVGDGAAAAAVSAGWRRW
jgi:hypothetical protein